MVQAGINYTHTRLLRATRARTHVCTRNRERSRTRRRTGQAEAGDVYTESCFVVRECLLSRPWHPRPSGLSHGRDHGTCHRGPWAPAHPGPARECGDGPARVSRAGALPTAWTLPSALTHWLPVLTGKQLTHTHMQVHMHTHALTRPGSPVAAQPWHPDSPPVPAAAVERKCAGERTPQPGLGSPILSQARGPLSL